MKPMFSADSLKLSAKRSSAFAIDFIACFLIIVSHFTNYIIYAGYSKLVPDIALIIGVLFCVSLFLAAVLAVRLFLIRLLVYAMLITIVLSDAVYEYGTADTSIRLIAMSLTLATSLALVFFLREHINKVLIGVFAAMLISTVGVSAYEKGFSDPLSPNEPRAPSAKPDIVHIILDEHMAPGGLSTGFPGGAAVQKELRNFYQDAGFRLFEQSYSQYFKTSLSLASALNFDATGGPQKYLNAKRYGFNLKKNAYFDQLADNGYRIRVFQSNYFDFCAEPKQSIESCEEYRPDNIHFQAVAGLKAFERAKLILNMYYSSFAVVKLLKLGEKPASMRWLAQQGIAPLRLGLWHGRVGPLAVSPVLDKLAAELATSSGGTVYFAHLLLPHYPYVYESNCAVRSPISSWKLRYLPDETNTPASRQERYKAYFDQLRCTMQKIGTLFEVLKGNGRFEETTFIIHGDHGSRINLFEPSAANAAAMQREDFIDAYSTLFALKAPNIPAGVDPRMLALPQLFRYAASGDPAALSKKVPTVIYLADEDEGFVAVPIPEFANDD